MQISFRLTTQFGSGWPQPDVADGNGDGLNHLILRASGREYAVFSGETFESRDFGNRRDQYLEFRGEHGYVSEGSWSPSPQAQTAVGEGNIAHVEKIPAGESLLYFASGTLQTSPTENITTHVVNLQDENPAENLLIWMATAKLASRIS